MRISPSKCFIYKDLGSNKTSSYLPTFAWKYVVMFGFSPLCCGSSVIFCPEVHATVFSASLKYNCIDKKTNTWDLQLMV